MANLVSVAEAARTILGGVGESTLRRWITEGQLPVVRLGRRLFIRGEALENFISRADQKRTKHATDHSPKRK